MITEIIKCSDCHEEVNEVSWGNEGASLCSGCRNIEGSTYSVFYCDECNEEVDEDYDH